MVTARPVVFIVDVFGLFGWFVVVFGLLLCLYFCLFGPFGFGLLLCLVRLFGYWVYCWFVRWFGSVVRLFGRLLYLSVDLFVVCVCVGFFPCCMCVVCVSWLNPCVTLLLLLHALCVCCSVCLWPVL